MIITDIQRREILLYNAIIHRKIDEVNIIIDSKGVDYDALDKSLECLRSDYLYISATRPFYAHKIRPLTAKEKAFVAGFCFSKFNNYILNYSHS